MSKRTRATLDLLNSDEFKAIIDTDDINVSDLTTALADSRLPDAGELAGYVLAWDDYVLVVDSHLMDERINTLDEETVLEGLEQRGLLEGRER